MSAAPASGYRVAFASLRALSTRAISASVTTGMVCMSRSISRTVCGM